MNSHIIKLAETEEEKLGAYRIRFQCLTLEMGDSLYANYEEETFKDKLDEAGKSKIFIALDPQTNQVVATQRITFRKEIEFTADYLYDYNSIAKIIEISPTELKQKTVLHDRSSTLKQHRIYKPSLFTQIFNLCRKTIANELAGGVIISFIDTKNKAALEMLINRFNFQKTEKTYGYSMKEFYQVFKLLD